MVHFSQKHAASSSYMKPGVVSYFIFMKYGIFFLMCTVKTVSCMINMQNEGRIFVLCFFVVVVFACNKIQLVKKKVDLGILKAYGSYIINAYNPKLFNMRYR